MDIEFIRNEIKARGYMRFEAVLLERVDELETQLSYEQDRNRNNVGQADERIKKLEEAIKKNEVYTRSHYQIVSLEDEELYAVLKEK